jgi:glycosyltransferase involved in cell wall biosynthesis
MLSAPLLTASLIVKDEEESIRSCLESLEGVADEVVVVDTGSTDRTREFALKLGARLYDFEWNGDFSAARNYGLDRSNGTWILYIDADERLRPESAGNLRAELSKPGFVGYEVLMHPRPAHTPYWVLRLFRNHPSVRFCGIIHENIWPALVQYRVACRGNIGKSEFTLDHVGYEGNQAAKCARNFPLLIRSLDQDPSRVYCWCHLANIYMDRGAYGHAEEAWQRALEIVRKKTTRISEDVLPYLGLIERGLAVRRDVSDLLAEGLSRFASNVQLHWLRGRFLVNEGQFGLAVKVFETFIDRGRSCDYDYGFATDLRFFDEFAYEALAHCHLRMGNYAESRRYYELAADRNPEKLEYRAKRALASHLCRTGTLLSNAAS